MSEQPDNPQGTPRMSANRGRVHGGSGLGAGICSLQARRIFESSDNPPATIFGFPPGMVGLVGYVEKPDEAIWIQAENDQGYPPTTETK